MTQLEHRAISRRLRVLRTSRPSMAIDRSWGRGFWRGRRLAGA